MDKGWTCLSWRAGLLPRVVPSSTLLQSVPIGATPRGTETRVPLGLLSCLGRAAGTLWEPQPLEGCYRVHTLFLCHHCSMAWATPCRESARDSLVPASLQVCLLLSVLNVRVARWRSQNAHTFESNMSRLFVVLGTHTSTCELMLQRGSKEFSRTTISGSQQLVFRPRHYAMQKA